MKHAMQHLTSFAPAVLPLALLLGSAGVQAETSMPGKAVPAPKTAYHVQPALEQDIGFSAAVAVNGMLYISGTVGTGDMPNAIKEIYDELQAVLAAHGLDFSDVVKENLYAKNLDDFIAHKDLRKTYYGKAAPAATWLQVQRMYLPEYVLEVELVAALRK